MVNQPVSLAVRVPSVRAMPGGDLIFHYSGGPLRENERNLQQPLEISSFQMITSKSSPQKLGFLLPYILLCPYAGRAEQANDERVGLKKNVNQM